MKSFPSQDSNEENVEKLVQDALLRARKVMGESVDAMTASALASARETLTESATLSFDSNEIESGSEHDDDSFNINSGLVCSKDEYEIERRTSPLKNKPKPRFFTFNDAIPTDSEGESDDNKRSKSAMPRTDDFSQEDSASDYSNSKNYNETLDSLIEANRFARSNEDITDSEGELSNTHEKEAKQRRALVLAEKEAAAALWEVNHLKNKQSPTRGDSYDSIDSLIDKHFESSLIDKETIDETKLNNLNGKSVDPVVLYAKEKAPRHFKSFESRDGDDSSSDRETVSYSSHESSIQRTTNSNSSDVEDQKNEKEMKKEARYPFRNNIESDSEYTDETVSDPDSYDDSEYTEETITEDEDGSNCERKRHLPKGLSNTSHIENNKDKEQTDTSNKSSELKGSNVIPSPPDSKPVAFRHVYSLPEPPEPPRPPSTIIEQYTLAEVPFKTIWKEPKPQLEALFIAIRGESVPRRSNACGALKVLTSKSSNRAPLARTSGVLHALTFAISKRPQEPDYDTGYDTLVRATSALIHLSIPVENRQIVFNQHNLLETLVDIIQYDNMEARVNCCTILTYLAKTPENRESMIKVPNLVKTLASVVATSIASLGDQNEGSQSSGDDLTPLKQNKRNSRNAKHKATRTDFITKAPEKRDIPQAKLDQYLSSARLTSCAVLTHLLKHCPNAAVSCKNEKLLNTLINVAQEFSTPLHVKCIEMICHLSRFRANSTHLSSNKDLQECLIACGNSSVKEDRIWTMRTIQNLTTEGKSKVNLAISRLLSTIGASAMSKEIEEHRAAVAALLNISTEPGAIVPLTNTKNVVATLVHLAHSSSNQETKIMACETLGTIGLWLQTRLRGGTVPLEVKSNVLPSHTCAGWKRWE